MSVRESALQFDCAGESLIGIVSHPVLEPADVGIVVVVGGPQYRAGSHRQFVLLARALAGAGYAALRFDCRGMGDSTGDAPGFERIGADIAAAIDALQNASPQIRRVVLWGLCDGASAALLHAHRSADRRVAGFVLANPWMHSEQAEAHAIVHSYYRQRLLDGAFWRKLGRGEINPLRKLGELFGHWLGARNGRTDRPARGEADQMLDALHALRLPVLLLLCRKDATAQAFLAGLQLAGSPFLAQAHVSRQNFPEADHTFSRAEWRREAEVATIEWLNSGYSILNQ